MILIFNYSVVRVCLVCVHKCVVCTQCIRCIILTHDLTKNNLSSALPSGSQN